MLGARLRSRTRARNGGRRPLAAQIRALFAQGEQGVWYDPSDLATLFQDAAGTTAVTAPGQPVGLILDKSGRGNHASQPTATCRPILQQDAGGRYFLLFDGIDDWLIAGDATQFAYLHNGSPAHLSYGASFGRDDGSDPNAFVIVAATSDGGTAQVGFLAGYDDRSSLSRNDRSSAYIGRGVAGAYAAAIDNLQNSAPVRTPIVFTDLLGMTLKKRVNGAQLASVAVNSPSAAPSQHGLQIGKSSAFYMQGRLYGLLIRGALSTDSQIRATERYLAGKTGVTLS